MNITWITIHTSDFEASKAFYGEYLGMRATRAFSPSPDMSIAFFAADNGVEVELIHEAGATPGGGAGNTSVSVGLRVANYDDLLARARSRGILRGEPVVLGPDVECFFVGDPDGVGVQVIRG